MHFVALCTGRLQLIPNLQFIFATCTNTNRHIRIISIHMYNEHVTQSKAGIGKLSKKSVLFQGKIAALNIHCM